MTYAQVHFGMAWDQLQHLTPRYFDALVRARSLELEADQRHSDWMIAQVVAMVANTGFRGWKEAKQPKDFLPTYPSDPKPKPTRKKRRTRAQIADGIRASMAAIFGTAGAT